VRTQSLRVVILAMAAAVAACGSPASSGTASPGATGAPTGSTTGVPTLLSDPPSTAPTLQPTPSSGTAASLPPMEFAFAQELEIIVDRLAVRTGPSTGSPLVTGARWDADRSQWSPTSEQVRLSSGDIVRISLGPIVHDGYTWYRVWSVTDALPEDEVRWNADGDDVYGDEGWIATSVTFVRARPPRGDVEFPPKVFAGGGSGAFLSEPFAADFLAGYWAIAPDQAPCNLRVTIEGTDIVLVGETGSRSFQAGSLRQNEDLGAGMHRLLVEAAATGDPAARCSWAIRVHQAQ